MKKIMAAVFALFISGCLYGQSALPIPPTLSGGSIDLYIADSNHQFFPGINTATIGYNGSYLGPTIILDQGQAITLNVHNLLSDTTTTHWHGLHVAPSNDGSPHNPIFPSGTWSPSFTLMDNAATYWYHPHLHGKTMDHVLKGAAGLIIVRDPAEAALTLPRTYGLDDIPLIFQFQTIDANTKQIVIDDEADNTTMVNGVINPFLNVPAQVVRLRMLNASSHRIFEFGFNDNRSFKQITSDAGLLNAPVTLNKLRLSSGERAEILVDFSGQQGNTYYIRQYGSLLPSGYPGATPSMGMTGGPLDGTDFNLLQINVTAPTATPVTTIPASLTTNSIYSPAGVENFNLNITAQPMNSMTNFFLNGAKYDEHVINFTTTQDKVMKWTITNQSMMAHPFHIHGNHFYVLSVNGAAPPANLQGRKDVVIVPPMNGTVQLITKYLDFSDPMMPYMYHCHILSHEEEGMMGQFIVNPDPAGIVNDELDNRAALYPNPASGFIAMSFKNNPFVKEISIADMTGRQVIVKEINRAIAVAESDITRLAPGYYIVKVITAREIIYTRLVVK